MSPWLVRSRFSCSRLGPCCKVAWSLVSTLCWSADVFCFCVCCLLFYSAICCGMCSWSLLVLFMFLIVMLMMVLIYIHVFKVSLYWTMCWMWLKDAHDLGDWTNMVHSLLLGKRVFLNSGPSPCMLELSKGDIKLFMCAAHWYTYLLSWHTDSAHWPALQKPAFNLAVCCCTNPTHTAHNPKNNTKIDNY